MKQETKKQIQNKIIKKEQRKTNTRQHSIQQLDIRIKMLQYFLGTNKCILSL